MKLIVVMNQRFKAHGGSKMYCNNCGTRNDGNKYCINCGNKLDELSTNYNNNIGEKSSIFHHSHLHDFTTLLIIIIYVAIAARRLKWNLKNN